MILSIIIPVYNVEKYIKDCLGSIYDQKVDESLFEVIIINDGTPDRSIEICKDVIAAHSNIKVIEQKNQGLSSARNTGIKNSSGKFLWFVDSDDKILPDSLMSILYKINTNEDIVCFLLGHREENDKGEYIISYTYNQPEQCLNGCSFLESNFYDCAFFIPVQFTVWKKDFLLFNNLTFHDGIYHEDCEFTIKAMVKAMKISFIHGEQYLYLRHNNTISTTVTPKRSFDYLKIIEELDTVSTGQKVIFDYMGLFFANALKNIIKCSLKNKIAFCKEIKNYKNSLSNLRYCKVVKYKFIGKIIHTLYKS